MSHRYLVAVLTVIAVVALTPMFAAAQSANTPASPRTPWGAPDLQGTWTNTTTTPLQRPADLSGQEFLTAKSTRYGIGSRGQRQPRQPRKHNGCEDERSSRWLQQLLAGAGEARHPNVADH